MKIEEIENMVSYLYPNHYQQGYHGEQWEQSHQFQQSQTLYYAKLPNGYNLLKKKYEAKLKEDKARRAKNDREYRKMLMSKYPEAKTFKEALNLQQADYDKEEQEEEPPKPKKKWWKL